jgi:hypothetical protein
MVLAFASALGWCANNMGGVIGYTTLKDYLVTVDYRNHTFRLDESNGKSYDQLNWCEFRYIDDTHLVGVPVKINNEGPFTFVIDTGAGGTVISTTLAKSLRLSMNPSEIICRGMGGDTQGYVVAIDQISVDSVSQEMIYVIALNLDEVSPRGCLIRNGILGYPFLKDFRLLIDYPNRKFALDS